MISNDSTALIQSALDGAINSVCENISCYVRDPVSDLTRHRLLPANDMIRFIIQMQAKSTQSELSDFYLTKTCPTSSAFCQQRDKLDPKALERVLHLFSDSAPHPKLFKGYRVLACDGSHINIPYNPDDKETFIQSDENVKGYNQLHLNALYDVLNGIYFDAMIDTKTKTHETGALLDMLKKYPDDVKAKTIITADRGYECYELFTYLIENHISFAVRLKDINSNGILSGLNLPDGEFDKDITRILTRKQTNEVKRNRKKYTFLPANVDLSYLDFYHDECKLRFRVTRFKITEDTYECLITNLPREEFTPSDLKELYHLRWEIEGSFRKLKYTVGMIYFHCRKQKYARQEIFASLIFFNYTQMLINAVPIEKENERKYRYRVRSTTAVTNARLYFRKLIKTDELIRRIKNFLSPTRPGRKCERHIKGQSAKLFLYRAC